MNQLDTEIYNTLNKAKLLGLEVKEIATHCLNSCYLVSISKTEHILLIPSNVTEIHDPEYSDNVEFNSPLRGYTGTLKVIGGQNLISTKNLFKQVKFNTIDISKLDTHNVIDMTRMFYFCYFDNKSKGKILGLNSLNTSKVKYMKLMFTNCLVEDLDLSNFSIDNVETLAFMFSGCECHTLNINSFNISKHCDIYAIFDYCVYKFHNIIKDFKTGIFKQKTLSNNRCWNIRLE